MVTEIMASTSLQGVRVPSLVRYFPGPSVPVGNRSNAYREAPFQPLERRVPPSTMPPATDQYSSAAAIQLWRATSALVAIDAALSAMPSACGSLSL